VLPDDPEVPVDPLLPEVPEDPEVPELKAPPVVPEVPLVGFRVTIFQTVPVHVQVKLEVV
jgi:hypothetical protein